MFTFGVSTFIWTENFGARDLWTMDKCKELGFETVDIFISDPQGFPTEAVKAHKDALGLEVVTTTTLGKETNIIDPRPEIRANGVRSLKQLVDINVGLGSRILGGVNYAGWGYLPGRPRTEEEWDWSVTAMREAAGYAKERSDMVITVEPVNRFETHFLNTIEDAVRYCQDVGTGNIKVHPDTFHMIREETSFTEPIEKWGEEYLGYVHVCENNRGIPGTGLVPWKEFFTALRKVGYSGPLVIESFDPSFEELNRLCAIWRQFADSGEALAVQGLRNLKAIAAQV